MIINAKTAVFLFEIVMKQIKNNTPHSLRSADVFAVVASLPPKINDAIFGGREATIGNTSALRRLHSTEF